MELGNQIKKYRSELQISQEQLADRIYVSRQTISNWENEKSYPDVNSLILLSEVFQTSIDKLIKGDIEIMKEKINEQEIKKLNYYGNIFCVHLAITILSAVPLFFLVGTACIYSVWNSFCNYDVLGFESGKGEKRQRYSDIQRDCSLFRR